ncbi:Signal transduction response regulator [Macleaya cordata]|uniref:Signal transduction response regulator n=1 Tax=Macleaya cordata TaxID=56857 RepID=A0A200R9H8_MACCD|nr:Signal transduction response regulator [Macleaya cordata]
MAGEDKFHVLAVDDNYTERKYIERLLKTSFSQVTVVDSGIHALEFLGIMEDEQKDRNPPSTSSDIQEVHLIITDNCMPEMTGYDLLKKIKESPSVRHIPVAIMSSVNNRPTINK